MKDRIDLRIDSKLKNKFKKKADAEFGGMSRFLQTVIEAYVAGDGFASDEELTVLMHAVRDLHALSNNVNQITRKMHSTGRTPKPSELQFLSDVAQHSTLTAAAFNDCLRRKHSGLKSLAS